MFREIYASEVFGPVATLERYDDFRGAVARVNDSRFGLQCGGFTRDLGREGVRLAMEEMTEPRLMMINGAYLDLKES